MFTRYTAILMMLVLAQVSHAEQRIISTDGFVTELIFALGMEQDLVGIDVTSRVPEGFEDLANIGYHRNLSAEGILSLSPSIVMGSEHLGPEPVVHALRAANIPLLRLPAAQTPEALVSNIEQVARALKRPDALEHLTAQVDDKVSRIAQGRLDGERIAFVLMVNTQQLRLAGRGSNGDAFIQLLGGSNVAEFDHYQSVSAESLLDVRPSLILVASTRTPMPTSDSHEAVRRADESVSQLLSEHTILHFSEAGKHQNIISVDGSSLIAGLSLSALDEALRLIDEVSPR